LAPVLTTIFTLTNPFLFFQLELFTNNKYAMSLNNDNIYFIGSNTIAALVVEDPRSRVPEFIV
jgi:hypothetical protein